MSRSYRAHLDAHCAMLAAWGEPWTDAAGAAEFEAYLKRREVMKPTPWQGGRVPRDEEPDTCVFGADGLFFGRVVGMPDHPAEEMCEFLLRAVNSHAALVAALEEAADRLEALGDGWSESVLIQCRTALKGTGG